MYNGHNTAVNNTISSIIPKSGPFHGQTGSRSGGSQLGLRGAALRGKTTNPPETGRRDSAQRAPRRRGTSKLHRGADCSRSHTPRLERDLLLAPSQLSVITARFTENSRSCRVGGTGTFRFPPEIHACFQPQARLLQRARQGASVCSARRAERAWCTRTSHLGHLYKT